MQIDVLNVPTFPRLDEYVGVWAIEPSRAQSMWALVRGMDLAAHVQVGSVPVPRSQTEMVAGKNGKSIAVIKATGVLMKQVPSATDGSSTIQLRREIRQAAADPNVTGILLAIDSPGGTAAGTEDLANDIRAARKQKPVYAQIEDLGASAAYWIASQAEKVFANNRTALVGSIGTIITLYDLSAAAEKEGVKALVFATGSLKGAGTPGTPVTEEQQAYFQGIVEQTQLSFDQAVRLSRKLTEKQLADVRTGGVFTADEALERKLIDGIQSMEKTLEALTSEARRFHSAANQPGAVAPTKEKIMEPETIVPAAPSAQLPAIHPDVQATRAAQAAESRRIAAIRQVCQANGNPTMTVTGPGGEPSLTSIEAHAIEQGWDTVKAELEVLRNCRPVGPVIKPGRADATPVALEAALCMSRGLPNIEKHFKPEILDSAYRYRNIGLAQMLFMCAAQNGYHVSPGEKLHNGNLGEIMRYAFNPGLVRARTSSVSLSGILGNVANKEIVAGYMEEDQTWREVAKIKNVSNFYEVTSYRMLDNMEYEELGPNGEIKHGSVEQESYTRKAKTYARMFTLTRRDWINDDLGAFDDLRDRIGRGGAKKFNNVFWTAFLAGHSTFFTTTRTNYISGGTTNLGTDGVGLGLGIKAFRQMKSPNSSGADDGGKRVGGNPDRLIVPPELEGVAEVLYRNQNLGQAANSAANIYANKYRPVVVPWLSDPAFTGYSTTAWYLFRNPMDLAMMVVSFLNGNQTPTVESADADFSTLGVEFRGYHDFGSDQAEYLAGLKSKGTA